MKRAGVVVLCALVGLAAGAIWTLLQSDRYRADARVLVRPASARIVPAVEALAESSLVATNVAQTLHLSSPPSISARRGDSGVLTVSANGSSRERARQVDAEAVVILMQKVQQRFATVAAGATVLDPAHAAEQTSPTAGRNLLITGLAGLIVGIAVVAAMSVGRPAPAAAAADVDLRVERRLQARIDQVTQRERALAQRAGQLAAREQDVAQREEEVERRAAVLEAARAAEPEPQPEPEPQLEPEPEPEPETVPDLVRPAGRWTLQALEALTRERSTSASVEQQEQWSTYLYLLRQHAGADGGLPSSFDPLVGDIFGPLPQLDE